MQSIDSIETYAYGTSKDLVSEKEEMKCSNIIIKRYKKWLTLMMLLKKTNWSEIPPLPNIWFLAPGKKTIALLNLINHEPNIDKSYIYVKDPYEAKVQFLIKKRESTGLKYLNDSKTFIEYNPNRKR